MHHDADVAHELEELHLPDKPDGPAAAVMISAGTGVFVLGFMTLMISAGTGVFVLGFMTLLNEMSEGIHDFLQSFEMGRGVGPLAGKTILGALGFFVAWLIFGIAWRRRDIDLRKVFWTGLVLGALGVVMMFPPVFEAFAG